MTQYLIATNSVDGTADALVPLLEAQGVDVFRWNIDLWSHYEIVNSPGGHYIIDPTGRTIDLNNNRSLLLWRKPFLSQMAFDGLEIGRADQEVARTHIGQWLLAVVAQLKTSGRVRLIEPYADRRLPKLYQLHEAARFFSVPQFALSIRSDPHGVGDTIITKPLGDPSVGSEEIFFTTRAESSALARPFPWFTQKALLGGADVTCVFVYGKSYFFECRFRRDERAVDWRSEINTPDQSTWYRLDCDLTKRCSENVSQYMRHLNLFYGRLDFIRTEDNLFFLECNSNGQFGWLDDPATLWLHKAFAAAALDPRTRVS